MLIVMEDGDCRIKLSSEFRSHSSVAEVVETSSVIEALVQLGQKPPDVMIIQSNIIGIDIINLCQQLNHLPISAQMRMVVIRPHSDASQDDELMSAGVSIIANLGDSSTELIRRVVQKPSSIIPSVCHSNSPTPPG
jgi:DNA-binding NarL/FixJ family response regulator